MTDREKLMKLLADAGTDKEEHCDICYGCEGCEYKNVAFCGDAYIADYLLEHGVMLATDNNDGCKWIP